MLNKYKNDILWLTATTLIILVLNISYMYSRDKTLNVVEKNQFNLFTNLMYSTSLNHKRFQHIANALTIIPSSSNSKKKQALFHIALITKDSCIENAVHSRNKPFLCDKFKTSEDIEKLIKGKTRTYISRDGQEKESFEYSSKELGIDDTRYRSYMIKKRKRSNKWIIAKKRYLSGSSNFDNFSFFIMHRYLNTTSLASKFRYTKFSTYIIIFVSFLLWMLHKIREQKRIKEYEINEEKNKKIQKEINKLEEKYNEDKIKKYDLEENIQIVENKLISREKSSKSEKENLLERIGKLRREEGILTTTIENDKRKIIELEQNSFKLENVLNKERAQLQEYKKDIEYGKLEATTTKLKLLWRHEPTWIERQQIEQSTSLKKTNLPFTLTQGFIAFEKHIGNEIKRLDSTGTLLNDNSFNLYAKIDYIIERNNLHSSDGRKYHDIRKARNKWFHSAIYPNIDIMDSLIQLLNDKDVNTYL